ncbi:MAG: hypothetical protein FH758_08270 [Firmicutes bacterium]|nr:hypothetical protein [Bacillota bacterium]
MRKTNLGIVVLVILLISNVIILQQINGVKEDIQHLRGDINSTRSWVQNSVNGVTNSVRNMVSDIEKEKRWITPVEVSLGEKNRNKQEVNLSWQIKDYTQGSEVYFYYRNTNSDTFQKISAKNIAGSTFAVDIELALDLKPEIRINKEYPSEISTNEKAIKAERIKEEKFKEAKMRALSSYSYEYYVEVHTGDNIRASEQKRLNLEKLKYIEFSRVQVNITYVDEAKYSFTVYEEMYGTSSNKLEKIFIKGIDSNGNSFKEQFAPRDKTVFTKTIDLGASPQRAELILEYDTGKIISEEVDL